MTYRPTERLDITWHARNRSWRHYKDAKRAQVTDLPHRQRGLGMGDLPPTRAGLTVRTWCEGWAEYPTQTWEPEWERGVGLLLCGETGVGKTTMACIAAQHVSDLGWATKFISVANLYELSKAPMNTKDDDEKEALADAFRAYDTWEGWPLVVLDDLGREHSTASGWSEYNLERIVRSRFSSAAPTIITTNLYPDDIGDRYGDAMGSYIHEAFTVVTVDGKDRRRGR